MLKYLAIAVYCKWENLFRWNDDEPKAQPEWSPYSFCSLLVQVRRNQDLNLRVTFEADIKCNISLGLLYSWTFFDSNDIPVELPLINTNMQIIYIPNNFLEYGRYTAVARVSYRNRTYQWEAMSTKQLKGSILKSLQKVVEVKTVYDIISWSY